VVYGPVERGRGSIDLRLKRHPDDRRLVIATTDDGLASFTHFERLAQADNHGCPVALMRCQIVTGRMHQVRVHMTASGWPLVGDPKYGEPRWQSCLDEERRAALARFPRQALHAWRTAFVHPFTQERVEVEAPLPDDLRGLMELCGLRTSGHEPT